MGVLSYIKAPVKRECSYFPSSFFYICICICVYIYIWDIDHSYIMNTNQRLILFQPVLYIYNNIYNLIYIIIYITNIYIYIEIELCFIYI